MLHSIGTVARMAGISSRTLRHYDAIGLLTPADVSVNGYRWYGRAELRRLQRILLLRDLDLPLAQIAAVLTGEDDEAAALRAHLMLVTAERDRLERVAATIGRTLDDLQGRSRLPDEEFFRGLDEGRSRLSTTLRSRFGPGALEMMDTAAQRTARWTRADFERAAAEGRDLYDRLSRARRSGLAPTSDEALDLVAEHHDAVLALWPADGAAYHALADLTENDAQQRDLVGARDPDLPSWLAAAMRAYAVRRLDHPEA